MLFNFSIGMQSVFWGIWLRRQFRHRTCAHIKMNDHRVVGAACAIRAADLARERANDAHKFRGPRAVSRHRPICAVVVMILAFCHHIRVTGVTRQHASDVDVNSFGCTEAAFGPWFTVRIDIFAIGSRLTGRTTVRGVSCSSQSSSWGSCGCWSGCDGCGGWSNTGSCSGWSGWGGCGC